MDKDTTIQDLINVLEKMENVFCNKSFYEKGGIDVVNLLKSHYWELTTATLSLKDTLEGKNESEKSNQ